MKEAVIREMTARISELYKADHPTESDAEREGFALLIELMEGIAINSARAVEMLDSIAAITGATVEKY